MNDHQEVSLVLSTAAGLCRSSTDLRTALGPQRVDNFFGQLAAIEHRFWSDHALDTYVLCFSEHDKLDNDGLLAMWRGYGGNGSGAALVFNSEGLQSRPDSPFILAPVTYLSTEFRHQWIMTKISEFSALLRSISVPVEQLHLAAFFLFERVKQFALFTKHPGFSGEQEWRVVYIKTRDKGNVLRPMFDSHIGPRGLEPKLKFKIQPITPHAPQEFDIESLIERIILGPTTTGPLARVAFERLLEKAALSSLRSKVFASSIPYRAM